MKLNKFKIFALSAVLMSFVGCGTKTLNHSAQSKKSIEMIEKDNYTKGYKQAIKDTKEEFTRLGFSKAKKILKLYTAKIRALEAGKYALKKGLVTPPEIIAIDNGNTNVSLSVTGCKIDRQRTPLEIMSFYNEYSDLIAVSKNQSIDRNARVSIDNITTPDTKGYSKNNIINNLNNKSVYVRVVNTAYNKSKLDSLGHPYIQKGYYYMLKFDTKEVANIFCDESKICMK